MRLAAAILIALACVADAEAAKIFIRDPEQLERYARNLAPGDTVEMQSGEPWVDVNLVFEGEGAPGRPIVFKAEKRGKTVLSGQSRLRVLGRHIVVDGLVFRDGALSGGSVIAIGSRRGATAQNCRLTNTAIVDYNPADSEVNYKWVSVYGRNNRVDHCYFKGQNHTGQAVVVWLDGEPNGHRIDHNYFAGRPPLGRNGGETIRVGTSAWSMHNSRTVIEDNLFENCDGEAEIISLKSCENVVRRNAFVASSGTVTLRHGNRNRIEGNWFVGAGKERAGGIRVIGEDHVVVNNYFEGLTGQGIRSAISVMNGVPDAPLNGYWQVKGGLIAHNTIVDCVSAFDIGVGAGSRGRTLAPSGVRIVANLVHRDGNGGVRIRDRSADVTWTDNVWSGEPAPEGFLQRTVAFDDGPIRRVTGDPASIAIEVTHTDVSADIDGQPRTVPVAGCDVPSTEAITYHVPTADTVGPIWMRANKGDGR